MFILGLDISDLIREVIWDGSSFGCVNPNVSRATLKDRLLSWRPRASYSLIMNRGKETICGHCHSINTDHHVFHLVFQLVKTHFIVKLREAHYLSVSHQRNGPIYVVKVPRNNLVFVNRSDVRAYRGAGKWDLLETHSGCIPIPSVSWQAWSSLLVIGSLRTDVNTRH